ncbi:MAG TPA: CerR family C-terminal domain-containing protein [Isosphaeraceae bacterium]|jgi:AcrR family transcriptional regulator|nr:CerR family C-terminal domain-containing protein [Isosphaeraceae bacterium]
MSEGDLTKSRLLEAAGEEFAERGFERATVRGICRRADVRNVAAVNYHFGDKERLYAEAVIAAHRCGVELPDEVEAAEGTPEERLRRFIHHFLQNTLAVDQERSWHHALLVREMTRPTSASQTLVDEVICPKFRRLLAIVGELCPRADDRRRTAIAFSVIGQCLHYRMGRPIAERLVGRDRFGDLDLEYLTDHITTFTLAALGRGPTPAGQGGASGEVVAGAAGEGGR